MGRRSSYMERQVDTRLTPDEAADVIASVNGVPLGTFIGAMRSLVAQLGEAGRPTLDAAFADLGSAVFEKRDKFLARGLYLPDRFREVAASAAPTRSPDEMSDAELLDIFRGPWQEFLASQAG